MSRDAQRRRLRATFEEVAEAYDRARPHYPADLIDDLVAVTQLNPGDRIVEIGCGTGLGSRPLAERRLEIVGIELGEQLSAIARRKLARFPHATVINGDFELWEPEGRLFDAVVAFTAFHWLDPNVRYEKSAELLRPGGRLVVVTTQHVLPEDGDLFFAEVQDDYRAVTPSQEDGPPPRPDAVGDLRAEIGATGLFGDVRVRRHVWDVTYDADEYIALLDTYSGHRSLPDDVRQRLYVRIRRRIDLRPTRHVVKSYLATLNVAERLQTPLETS